MWKASICSGERRLPTEGDFVWLLPREKQKNQKLFAYLKEGKNEIQMTDIKNGSFMIMVFFKEQSRERNYIKYIR